MGQAIENGSYQTLDLAIPVELHEAVKEQGRESAYCRPNHEVGSAARHFGQEASIDQPIQLRHEYVMRVRRNHGSGFSPAGGISAQAFKGAATIMYNAAQRDELQRKGPSYLGTFKGMGPAVEAELADAVFVEPDSTYAESEAEIDLGGHRAVLRTWGAGHTSSDQTVLVDGRVLFTGDLLETRMFPILPYLPPYDVDVDGSRWMDILGEFLDLQPEIVVPGHGEVNDRTLIRDVRTYLEYVRGETARLRAAGTSADDTATIIDKDARARWSTWEHPEWINFAAHAFCAASTGV